MPTEPVARQEPAAAGVEWPFEVAYREGIIPRMQLEAARFFRQAGTGFLRRLEAEWPPPVQKQADRDLEEWLRRLLADPNLSAERLADALQPYVEQALGSGAASAHRRTPPSWQISWDLKNPEAVRWLRRWRIPFRRQVDETTHQEILRRLVAGIDRGAPFEEIAADLRSLFGAWERWRAELVAHTEGNRAISEGQLIYWKSARVTIVRYVTAQDELTCPICLPLHGREMKIEQARGYIPRHPRCRCYWEPVKRAERRPSRQTLPMTGATPAPPASEPAVRIWDEARDRPPDEAEAALEALQRLADADVRRRLDGVKFEVDIDPDYGMLRIRYGSIRSWVQTPPDVNREQLAELVEALNAETSIVGQLDRLRQMLRMAGASDRELPMWMGQYGYIARHIGLERAMMAALLDGPAKDPQSGSLFDLPGIFNPTPRTPAQQRSIEVMRGQLRDAARWLAAFVRGPLAAARRPATVHWTEPEWEERAYYRRSTTAIAVGAGSKVGTIVHEMGHHLHYESKTAWSLVRAWFRRRIAGERLTTILRWKGQDEAGYRDRFFDHYIGKVYGDNDMDGREVVSMGMEAMATRPVDFLALDPDHFRLIYGLARGIGADD